jgi:predicted nucleic acid-binding Zn ribbon protein
VTERLSEIFKEDNTGLGRTIRVCRLLSLWHEVVDERIGKHTEAVKIRNRVLYINASTSTWANELSFLRMEMVKRFNEKAGEEAIRDIRFSAKSGRMGG